VFPDLTKISRHPGLNVGYWNLEQRQLTRTDGDFRIDGRPLVVFHFSGFDPANPWMLSKYVALEVKRGSPLDDLCRLYTNELEAIAPLKLIVAKLTKLPCSEANLNERMLKGSIQNELSLVTPSIKSGPFSRIGRRADFLLSRVVAILRSTI
jgi:hypothetical protein